MKYSLTLNFKIPTCTYGNLDAKPDIEVEEGEIVAVFDEFKSDIQEAFKEDPLFEMLKEPEDLDKLSPYRKMLIVTRYLALQQLVDIREDLSNIAGEYKRNTGNDFFQIIKGK